jgi:hypothetical protein
MIKGAIKGKGASKGKGAIKGKARHNISKNDENVPKDS